MADIESQVVSPTCYQVFSRALHVGIVSVNATLHILKIFVPVKKQHTVVVFYYIFAGIYCVVAVCQLLVRDKKLRRFADCVSLFCGALTSLLLLSMFSEFYAVFLGSLCLFLFLGVVYFASNEVDSPTQPSPGT